MERRGSPYVVPFCATRLLRLASDAKFFAMLQRGEECGQAEIWRTATRSWRPGWNLLPPLSFLLTSLGRTAPARCRPRSRPARTELFADAELAEHAIQHIVDVDGADDVL
jgi:hypothetical protein